MLTDGGIAVRENIASENKGQTQIDGRSEQSPPDLPAPTTVASALRFCSLLIIACRCGPLFVATTWRERLAVSSTCTGSAGAGSRLLRFADVVVGLVDVGGVVLGPAWVL